jgi:integrase
MTKSLETKKKGLAEYRLDQYIKGKFGLMPTPTVKEFYDRWIESKVEPLIRRSLIRDYKQTFTRYVLPAFADRRLSEIGTKDLKAFQLSLLHKGLSVKTCRNIIEGSFRALYRDARADIDALKGKNPWFDLRWPRAERKLPDPFEPHERDKILEYFRDRESFYYPWVLLAFSIGIRPGEACALKWSDVDVGSAHISINKSRHLGIDNQPKTKKSWRRLPVPRFLIDVLLTLPSYGLGDERVFLNKQGGVLDASQWAKDYWERALKGLGIRHRRFYCARHTFITQAVKRGWLLKSLADYCGNSVSMIESNYCAVLTLNDLTVFEPLVPNYQNNLASPTGFEPVLSA